MLMNKEENYLNGIEYSKDIDYVQYLDRREDETRLYDCGGIPVELTLPKGEHFIFLQEILHSIHKKGFCIFNY